MKYLCQVSLALIGLISITSFEGCTHRNSSPVAESIGSQVAENENLTSAAKDVITRYYTFQIQGDYNAAYNCLSIQTQKRIARNDFVSKARANNTSSVQFKSVSNIHVEQQTGDKMMVGYTIQAVINEAEADRLRKAGHPSAKAGPYTFTTVNRQLIREDGKWRIELPPK